MKALTVEDIYRSKGPTLGLELLTPDVDLQREVDSPTLSSPGLVLAGFRERFLRGRLQVLGETEIKFLFSLDDVRQRAALDGFLRLQMPALFVTKGLEVPPALIEMATA
ncbi:MAG: HPr kinase/phosphorylase, partial [Gemmatimonadota bacterium]